MVVGIRNNLLAQGVQRNLKSVNQDFEKEILKLSSGKEINNAGDNPAGLAIAKNLESSIRSLRQAGRNANEGMSLIQTAEGGLNEIGNILMRLRELAIQSANETLDDRERGYLQQEYSQLYDEINRISQTTEYNGINLINGSQESLDLQVGIHAGNSHVINLKVDSLQANTDKFKLERMGISSADDAMDSLQDLDGAINNVSEKRALLGGYQNRLSLASSHLDTLIFNQEVGRSNLEDVDFARAASKVVQLEIMQNAAISALAQVNNLSSNMLRLL